MNKNIKDVYDRTLERTNPDFLSLFAEEIIRECAKVCEELRFCDIGPTPAAKYQRDLCAAAIKKHFGVN
jgi:hypothetical protein